MFFYVWWIGITAAALWVSIAAFVWAAQSGQFSDQQRARYLPLRNENLTPPAQHENPSRLSIEVYALMVVLFFGLLSIAMILFMIFTTHRV
jgi:nitrogen fixation-related uncharacterized protein